MTTRSVNPQGAASTAVTVPDASVAAKWFLNDEAHVAQARAVLTAFQRGELRLIAPDCFYYECAGLLLRAERRSPPRLTPTQVDIFIDALASLQIERVESQMLIREAVARARHFHTSPYDAMYLIVAEQHGATFMTADEPLFGKIKHLPYVRLLGDSGGSPRSDAQALV